MLFDVSSVENVHLQLFQNGNLGDAYRTATLACVRLIEDATLAVDRYDELAARIVVDLGIRMINGCGAAATLALAGFWSPANHQLRDIVECHQLIEYFRRVPSDAQKWVELEGMKRYQQFGFGRVYDKLVEERGQAPFNQKSSFDFFSNVGSHPSAQALGWHMSEDGELNIGPIIHKDRFRLFTADLWAHMTRATLEFAEAMDTLNPGQKPIRERFPFRYGVVAGAENLLAGVTAAQVREYWK